MLISHSPLEIRDFEENFSFSSRLNEILRTDSLLESKNFERKNSVSPLNSPLNFLSNSGEKSYFAIWLDFDQQCFAERESILKRQLCVVEQYSNFSQQRHFCEMLIT